MADIKITNDDLLASHCRNSLNNSDNPALLGGMSLSFGNAVNLLRCSNSNVNWRLAEKIPTEDEIIDKVICVLNSHIICRFDNSLNEKVFNFLITLSFIIVIHFIWIGISIIIS